MSTVRGRRSVLDRGWDGACPGLRRCVLLAAAEVAASGPLRARDRSSSAAGARGRRGPAPAGGPGVPGAALVALRFRLALAVADPDRRPGPRAAGSAPD